MTRRSATKKVYIAELPSGDFPDLPACRKTPFMKQAYKDWVPSSTKLSPKSLEPWSCASSCHGPAAFCTSPVGCNAPGTWSVGGPGRKGEGDVGC